MNLPARFFVVVVVCLFVCLFVIDEILMRVCAAQEGPHADSPPLWPTISGAALGPG